MTKNNAQRLSRAVKLSRRDPVAAISAIASLRRESVADPALTRAIRRIARDHAVPVKRHAQSLARAARWSELARFLTPLLSVGTADSDLLVLGAESFIAVDQPRQAIRLLRGSRPHRRLTTAELALLGQALAQDDQAEEARNVLAEAMRRGHAQAGVILGQLHLRHGDKDAAIAAWRNTVAYAPEAGDAWMHLAQHGWDSWDAELTTAMDQAAQSVMSAPAQVCFDFACGNIALEQGETDAGFAFLDRANAAHRAHVAYDPNRDAAIFAAIQSRSTRLISPPAQPPRILFVTGLPRSGTSLTERIIASHPNAVAGGELTALYAAVAPVFERLDTSALPEIAEGYRAAVAPARGTAQLLVDKMPLNFRWIGPALAALPEARVVFLRRPLPAVALSLYRHHFGGAANRFAYDIGDILTYANRVEKLMAHWQQYWGEDRLRCIDFDDLIDSPSRMIPELLAFAGLQFDPACLRPDTADLRSDTASAAQVHAPMHTDISQRWMRWEAEIRQRLETAAASQDLSHHAAR